MRFDGGRLCLDFVNTIHDRFDVPQRDYLNSIDDLLDWAVKAEIINVEQRESLKGENPKDIDYANRFLNRAIDLRELLHSIFLAISLNKSVDSVDIEIFNKVVSKSFSKLCIEQEQKVFITKWTTGAGELEKILLSITKDAYDLLLLNLPDRIKECPKCGWLFFDSSKNGRRKWCSMATCGSQHKASQWYQRNKH